MNYDDGRVACTDDALVIRWYYFPFGTKRIRYADIQKVSRLPLDVMNGRWRMWGSSDFVHSARAAGDHPDNPDGVAAALAGHGVNVS